MRQFGKRFYPRPSFCTAKYAERWPTGQPFTHDQLRYQRRGRYWQQIIAVPHAQSAYWKSVNIASVLTANTNDELEDVTATVEYQKAEYDHGYGIGVKFNCDDAEWYITWLVYHTRGLNMPNGWLTGYIHGKHKREHGESCEAEKNHRLRVRDALKAQRRTEVRGGIGNRIAAPLIQQLSRKEQRPTFESVVVDALRELAHQ